MCGLLSRTLTLLMTQICDCPYPNYGCMCNILWLLTFVPLFLQVWDQFPEEEKLAQQHAILLFATHIQRHFVVLKVAQQCHHMQMKCNNSLPKGLARNGILLTKTVITLIDKIS